MVNCICIPEIQQGYKFNQWIGNTFQTCAYSPWDILGFSIGMIQIGCWFVAQAPQLIKVYRNKATGQLSPYFLSIWLFSDVFNLLSCILTNQSHVQFFTAWYFLAMDSALLLQYFYYNFVYRGKPAGFNDIPSNPSSDSSLDESSDFSPSSMSSIPPVSNFESAAPNELDGDNINNLQVGKFSHASGSSNLSPTFSSIVPLCIAILALSSFTTISAETIHSLSVTVNSLRNTAIQLLQVDPPICDDFGQVSIIFARFGTICGWLSSIGYVICRIPQMMANYRAKSTRGVSFTLFWLSFTANCLYALSVVIPTTTDLTSVAFWRDTFPFIVGSAGANLVSGVIIVQFFIYADNDKTKSDLLEEKPLTVGDDL